MQTINQTTKPETHPLTFAAASAFLQKGEEDRIVREPERANITGDPRSTWHRKERAGLTPKRVQLSPGAVGWWLSELRAHMRSLPRVA
jgi:predicted DNA-binding transcriptional regulator AlpA